MASKKTSLESEIKKLRKEVVLEREKAKLEGERASLKKEISKSRREKLVRVLKGAKSGMKIVGNILDRTFKNTQPLGTDLKPIRDERTKKRK